MNDTCIRRAVQIAAACAALVLPWLAPQAHAESADRDKPMQIEADHMTSDELDMIGERGQVTAGDLVCYLMNMRHEVEDWTAFTAPPAPPRVTEETLAF